MRPASRYLKTLRWLMIASASAAMAGIMGASRYAPGAEAQPAKNLTLPIKAAPVSTRVFDMLDTQTAGFNKLNAYAMALVSHYMYPHAYLPRAEVWTEFKKQFEPLMKEWGMTKVELVQSGRFAFLPEGSNHVQYAIMSNSDVVVVAFRGSDHLEGTQLFADWVATNALGLLQTEKNWGSYGSAKKWPQVHKGFRDAYWDIRLTLNQKIREHLENGTKPKALFITGHSLGGALATICALDQARGQDHSPPRRFKAQGVYTFGAPRVGDGVFANLYASTLSSSETRSLNTHRFLRCGDFAAGMPPNVEVLGVNPAPVERRWTHVGTTHLTGADGKIIQPTQATIEQAYDAAGCGDVDFDQHDSKLYTCDLFREHISPDARLSIRVPGVPAHKKDVLCP